jgi:hypothetical protein
MEETMAKSGGNNGSSGLVDPETGQSIEDMDPEQTLGAALAGTEEQLSFDLGSEYQLSESTLKLTAVPSMSVDGQYREGDRVKVVLEIEVEYVSFPPVKDRGFRVGTERRHYGQVLSASTVDE